MIRLGINEFVRNFKRNMLVVIQLAVLLVTIVLLVSTYETQTLMGRSVMKYIDSTGALAVAGSRVSNERGLAAGLKDVETVVAAREGIANRIVDEEGNSTANIGIVAYDENIVSYRPRLRSGVWYDEADSEEGVINIVIGENSLGYDQGDIIESKYDNPAGQEKYIKFRVVGTVYRDTMLFGLNRDYGELNASYLYLFNNAASREPEIDENMPEEFRNIPPEITGVISYDDMNKCGFFTVVNTSLIDFKDDISEEDMKANIRKLNGGGGLAVGTEVVESNSKTLIFEKIGSLLMLFIVLVALSVTSIISSSEVNFIYERRNYGIYFITGNSWGKTLILSAVNWICVILFSILMSVTVMAGLVYSGLSKHLTLIWMPEHILSYVIVSAVTMVIALIIPAVLLRRSQPVEILKNV